MPQVGAFLAATWAGTNGAFAAFALKTAASLAINAAVSKLLAPKGARPGEIQTELKSSSAKRIRHLGRVRASGAVMFWDWANVGPFRRLFKLIAVAQGGMSEVHQWYLNGEPVTVDADGYVQDSPWNKGRIRLQFRKGIQGDQWDGGAFPELRSAFPNDWTVEHRLRGVGCILAQFDAVDDEDIGEVYSGGEPEVTALISGPPAYRPGDGGYEQSRNAARLFGDVLTNPAYGPLGSDEINTGYLLQAVGVCNQDVPTEGGTRPQYWAGFSYALSDPIKDTANSLLQAMGGRAWIDTDGKLAVRAGVWVPPTVTIEERHIVEIEYGAGTERISRVTALQPSYVAPEINWQETTADLYEDAGAIALWGEGEPKSIDLMAVQHHGQVGHLCKQQLAKMNPRRRITAKLRAFGLRLLDQQVVAVNIPRLGLANVPFWIEEFGWDGTNATVELLEADPASFDWTAAEEGEPPEMSSDVETGVSGRSISIDSVTVVTDDGPPYIRITGSVVASAGDRIIAQYQKPNGIWTDMSSATPEDGKFAYRTPGLSDRSEYAVRVFFGRYQNSSGGRELIQVTTPIVVPNIEVVANNNPPGNPVVESQSGTAGGTLTVRFLPDLGANYHRTGLYRAELGGSFSDATFVKWSYGTSSDVTMTAPIPATGARFWLQSENESGVNSGQVLVGNYS